MATTTQCPECGTRKLVFNKTKGEVICRECGLVLDDTMVDFTQEWRDFDNDVSQRRAGAPMTYTQYDRGLGTEVGTRADLSRLTGKSRSKFFRLRKWQYRVSTSIERNLKMALSELKRMSSFLKLPKSVDEEAARMYTLAVQRGLVRGRSMEVVVAGVLYAACRTYKIPRTLEEMETASGINRREIGRTYRFIVRELDLKILPSQPSDFISRFASALKFSPETQSYALKIIEKTHEKGLTSGRGPSGIAASALYVSALIHDEKTTQKSISRVCGVTEVTIRNRYKEILEKIDGLKKKLHEAQEKQRQAMKD